MGLGNARILLDATRQQGGGAAYSYLVDMIPELVRSAPGDEFLLFVRNPRLAEAMPDLPNLAIRTLPPVGIGGRLRFTYADGPRLAREWRADLYYSTGEDTPLHATCPTIGTCQNFNIYTPLPEPWPEQPEFRGRGAAARMASSTSLRLRSLRSTARLSALTADRMVFVSQTASDCIGKVLGLPEARRAVVHHGIDLERWRPTGAPAPLARPYILSVGSIYRYKNYVRLIEAYVELVRRRAGVPDLVLIGGVHDAEYADSMRVACNAAGAAASRIHFVEETPYAEVPRWYAGASMFVFPSLLETFGLPVLESMASGVPLVASDLPVFREIAADAALYADPYDSRSLATAMEEVLFRPDAAEVLVKRGHQRVRDFTWRDSVIKLLRVFRETIAERRPARARASSLASSIG